ncbi:MAG: YihY/virulence factor BrkB family protein [Egicoccus sp.]
MGLADQQADNDANSTGSTRHDEVVDVRRSDERADEARAAERRGDGNRASSPTDIPSGGWKAIGKRVVTELKSDHVSLLAAGVAFKGFLAIFPTIIAAISIWGLIADPQQIEQQMSGFLDGLPENAAGILQTQMNDVASSSSGALSFALAGSLLLALWSASGGMAGLMEGINAAYNEVDRRKFPKKRGIALGLTLAGIVFLLLTLGLIAVLPAVSDQLGLGRVGELAISIGKWPLLAVLVMGALAYLYKVAPDRDDAQMKWTSVGAVVATVLWLIGSGLFTLYIDQFGKFGETYGAFAGVIVLMLWLFLTGFIVLLGAEINAEQERQTLHDTTQGEPRPMGARDAYVADNTPSSHRGRTP